MPSKKVNGDDLMSSELGLMQVVYEAKMALNGQEEPEIFIPEPHLQEVEVIIQPPKSMPLVSPDEVDYVLQIPSKKVKDLPN